MIKIFGKGSLCLLSALAASLGLQAAQAACSTYPTGTAAQFESAALDSRFGPTPKPSHPLHFAYITKTLINQFWQDAAAAAQAEAQKNGITLSVQAAQDEASMMQQLNLAQTTLSQKPDALLLSPESDTNLEPVIAAARAANIPTVVIDDARSARPARSSPASFCSAPSCFSRAASIRSATCLM